MSGHTLVDLQQAFKKLVTSMVKDLDDTGHFLNRDKLPTHQRAVLDSVLGETLRDSDLSDVLFNLSKILSDLHGKKTIVLIDEHDTPMTNVAKQPFAEQVFPSPSRTLHTSHLPPRHMIFSAPSTKNC